MPAEDLEHILAHTADLWPELRGARLFITGATGFFGKWLLESVIAANDVLGAGIGATLLSRNPADFAAQMPRLALRREFEWLQGKPESFDFPAGPFDYVIHLATPSAAEVGAGDTALLVSALQGMQQVLQFARQSGAKRLLLASSGAVYGPQPAHLGHIPEDYDGAPDLRQPMSAYGELKRMSELMCAMTPEVECVIARGFAFIGPYLPLSDKFAVGSFIRDALAGGPVKIHGNGTPLRSYLYGADLAIWMFTLLLKGKPAHPYNVGSDQAISLAELAKAVAAATDGLQVEIGDGPVPGSTERYVPAIQKARNELGLDVRIPQSLGLSRTLDWAKRQTTRSSR
ncbi:MAG: NAD(P)-dependent oxidoreductase [Sulfuritalea sp.]|nr:NAD(P)-dependent oxidoreductase [Sulfuritalea sp.]